MNPLSLSLSLSPFSLLSPPLSLFLSPSAGSPSPVSPSLPMETTWQLGRYKLTIHVYVYYVEQPDARCHTQFLIIVTLYWVYICMRVQKTSIFIPPHPFCLHTYSHLHTHTHTHSHVYIKQHSHVCGAPTTINISERARAMCESLGYLQWPTVAGGSAQRTQLWSGLCGECGRRWGERERGSGGGGGEVAWPLSCMV